VVYCDRDTQIERLMRRNQITRQEAEARIAAQMSSTEKRKYADYEIDTTGGFDQTRQRVIEIHRELQRLSKTPKD
jgi:dephospho-CoA kinase